MRNLFLASFGLAVLVLSVVLAQPKPDPKPEAVYVKKATHVETAKATLASFGMPNLSGKWYFAGPFDNPDKKGIDVKYPPEKEVDLKATFVGKNDKKFGWQEFKGFELGKILDLKMIIPEDNNDAVIYLYHEFDATEAGRLPISLGSDDTMSVFFNGTRILNENREQPAAPDQFFTQLKLKAGKNQLLLKVCQYGGGWEVYVAPELPDTLPQKVQQQFAKDFPRTGSPAVSTDTTGESKFYEITTIQEPADCVLEVGGLAFRPDGKLLACTRRGEIWLISNPTSKNQADIKFTKFASGLHEALGIYAPDNKTVYVGQRPELTRVVDSDGDGVADEFNTVSDAWGVSGDYHEYCFGPAVDKAGDMYVTLNVGFGGGHQAKGAFRGWCMKIDPKTGKTEPFAYGLRSPNGVTVSPEGDLFYADNQGEWCASNKLCHIQKGKFYGHQAGLRWLKDSPYAERSDKVASGMMYDGQPAPGKTTPKGFPEVERPAIWFPYGRMGQSVSEPKWDTTAGKFGPFTGQIFVGDQTKAVVMRVALEKVNGVFQGACFPFRSGFQCGVNRLAFGPDGSLYVGQTNRGWGSLGGKPQGLQRLSFLGDVPMEVHTVKLTKTGFDFSFTKPLDPDAVAKTDAFALKSFTYIYNSNYGCPETDTQPEKVAAIRLSGDRKTVSLDVPELRVGRVYDFKLNGVRSADGRDLLHKEAYYTLNELLR